MISFLHPGPAHEHFRANFVRVFTIVWAGVIFELSTETFGGVFSAWLLTQILHFFHIAVSPHTFATLHFLFRKTAHVTEYGIFSMFIYYSLEGSRPHAWRLRVGAWSVALAGMYSLTDEFHQRFSHGRTPALHDCALDTLGATFAMLFLYGVERVFHAKSKITAESEANMAEVAKGTGGE